MVFGIVVALFWCAKIFYSGILHDFFEDRKPTVSSDEPIASQTMQYESLSRLKQGSVFQKGSIFVDDYSAPIPTNQWFSSVAFSKTSEPIFAYPLAVKMNDNGFGISYPSIVSTPDTVFGSYVPDVSVTFPVSSLLSSVHSYDDLSVLISQKNGGGEITSLRVTHGSPFIFATVAPNLSFDILANNFRIIGQKDSMISFSVGGKSFAVFFPRDGVIATMKEGGGIKISTGDAEADIAFALLPDGVSADEFSPYAFNPIVATRADFNVQGSAMKSQLSIETKDGGDTLFALLPKSISVLDTQHDEPRKIGVYQTIRGEQTLFAGKSFFFSREFTEPPLQLDFSLLSDKEKDSLREQLREDVQQLSLTEKDTYFLGKKLFSMANLLDLADGLGRSAERDALKETLKTELESWRDRTLSDGTSDDGFVYDPIIKGIVGYPSSFGSERFNDHHFHYGYFIYAASILARYDIEYLSNNEQFINLLVKDIANIDRSDASFSYVRGFDAYEGHSWASGEGLFADGNNQESSSEAVNAWYALYLWSEVIHHDGLRNMALALYAEESASALEYWLNIDTSDARFAHFKHPFVSLLWGGKLDSATWFSPKPEAKLGIQILPISPGSLYLGSRSDRVRENILSEPELQQPTLFRDSLAAYRAFFDPVGALEQVRSMALGDMDGANSKSFVEAWILTNEFGEK
mgnify:FL=1